MEQKGELERDGRGRFAGDRVHVEAVPRLPAFPARWVMEDPRGRPYFVFWITAEGGLSYHVRMVQAADGCAVTLSTPEQTQCRIEVVRRPMPRRGGTALLYRCPRCRAPRRYLYGLALIRGRLVDDGVWRCHHCAGLLFVSQGRYRRQLERAMFAAFYGPAARIREPLPRHPWDPQAVSDPRLIVDRFQGELVEGSAVRGSDTCN